MAESINDILARTPSGGTAVLPSGEFEGPVYITKPIRLMGNTTTIWAKRGSVIEITANGAAIENLRIELTEGDSSDKAVVSHGHTDVKDVEILGSCSGFGDEDKPFCFPKTINLGNFAADRDNSFKLKVCVPVETKIESPIAGVSFFPTVLSAGDNELTIMVAAQSGMTFLYGEILLKSQFTRRIYLSGRPAADGEACDNKMVYDAARDEAAQHSAAVAPAPSAAPAVQPQHAAQQNTPAPSIMLTPASTHMPKTDVYAVNTPPPLFDMPVLDMRRGQRIALYQYVGNSCEVFFSATKPGFIEVDPYAFLLNSEEKSCDSKGLVFFGNESSTDEAVRYNQSSGTITINFSAVDYRVQRIALAYSIYGGNAGKCFSQIKSPKISITAGGHDRITYSMYGLTSEITVVALEFYRYKGEWKVSAVGSGYRDSLVKLCNNYGIEVTD